MTAENPPIVDTQGAAANREALYVYCIGEQKAFASLFDDELPEAIEASTSLQLITEGELAIVASVVPLSDYGEAELPSRLLDAPWVASRAMRHERVLEYFAKRASLVPLRFGTIYLKRTRIEKMLAANSESLLALLEDLRGKDEWGLNVFCDRTKIEELITSLSPTLREMAERAAAAPPGQAYLLRKKIDAMRGDEARLELKRAASAIEGELSGLSSGSTRLRVRQAEAAEHGALAGKFAFLVDRAGFPDFRATAEKLAEQFAGSGFRLELTGPWPAYNFVSDLDKE
jgi:hypothetical protein